MKLLSVDQRQFIIDLYRDGDRTQVAIADLVGTTQGNVSKVLSQARQRDPLIRDRCKKVQAAAGGFRQRTYAASQLGSFAKPFNLDLF